MKGLFFVILAAFSAHAAFSGAEMPFVTAEGRLAGTFNIESSPGSGTYAVMSFSKSP